MEFVLWQWMHVDFCGPLCFIVFDRNSEYCARYDLWSTAGYNGVQRFDI